MLFRKAVISRVLAVFIGKSGQLFCPAEKLEVVICGEGSGVECQDVSRDAERSANAVVTRSAPQELLVAANGGGMVEVLLK